MPDATPYVGHAVNYGMVDTVLDTCKPGDPAGHDLPAVEVIEASVMLMKGFSDATRLKILCLLRAGEVCVHEIVEQLDISQSGISHQLRILRDARLVKSRKDGRHVYYRLADEHVRQMLENALSHGEEAT